MKAIVLTEKVQNRKDIKFEFLLERFRLERISVRTLILTVPIVMRLSGRSAVYPSLSEKLCRYILRRSLLYPVKRTKLT